MTRLVTVVETPAYLARASKLMTSSEMADAVNAIAAAPHSGDVIRRTGGLRKLRVSLEGRGKRGGGRIVYWFHNEDFPAVLLWAFAKNEATDLTMAQQATLRKATAGLLDEFRSSR